MALFNNTKKNITKDNNKISSATIITSCTDIIGDINGTDTIHIDGKVTGNISVHNTLVIGNNGVVIGDVKAKNAIINGQLNGSLKCENLEVMHTGKVSNNIEANHITFDGKIDGQIIAHEDIVVQGNSIINATLIKSKKITVNGNISGTIVASEILEIGSKGFVEGSITVKNIKTEEGGRMIGTMSTYTESTPVVEKKSKEIDKQDDKKK